MTTPNSAPTPAAQGQAPFPRMHVSLYSSNIDRTVEFYRGFFAQEPAKVMPGYAKFELAAPALIISFVEKADRVQSAFGHLGFQVQSAEALAKHIEAARQMGFPMLEEKGTACCYAVQDKFWITDPDGHQWEVYHFHEDVAFNDPHYALDKDDTCTAERTMAAAGVPQHQANPVHNSIQASGLAVSPSPAKAAEPCCAPGSGCC